MSLLHTGVIERDDCFMVNLSDYQKIKPHPTDSQK